jgi:excisionase family DNA binding protein
VTIEEAATLLKVSRDSVQRWVVSNALPAERWGFNYILSRKVVQEFGRIPRKRGRPKKDLRDGRVG